MITITESAQEYLAELLSCKRTPSYASLSMTRVRPAPKRVLPIVGMAISKRVMLSRPLTNSRPGFKAGVSRSWKTLWWTTPLIVWAVN